MVAQSHHYIREEKLMQRRTTLLVALIRDLTLATSK
jgi:hypothetical protein